MRQKFTYPLMSQSRNGHNHNRAHRGRHHNGDPLLPQQLHMAHKRHTCRHKEKSEVSHQEVGYTLHMPEPDHAQLQSRSEQKHAYDTRRHRHTRGPYHKLAQCQKREDHSALHYHHNFKFFNPANLPHPSGSCNNLSL